MMKLLNSIFKYRLFTGSVLMIIGSNLINGLNYIYHFIMGRMLGPASYGELSVLFSLMGLLGIFTLSFGLVIVKFVSGAKSDEEVKKLANWINKKIILVSLIFGVFIVLISPFLSEFLNIGNLVLFVLIAFYAVFSYPAFFNRSILQGLLKFKEMLFSILVDNSIKLTLGILMVYLGYSVGGALFALVVASMIGWLSSIYFIKDYLDVKTRGNPQLKAMFVYSIPVFIQSVAVTSLYSSDLVLVKHFFSSYESGLYAALSTFGKIIFFATAPISSVMFPLISRKHSKGEGYHKVFLYSLLLTLGLSISILAAYFVFPRLIIEMLYGPKFIDASYLLFKFGLFMTIFTTASLVISYYLSLGKSRIVIFPLFAAAVQLVGIWLYHDSLDTVINVSILVVALLLICLFIYYGHASKINISYSSRIQAGKYHTS
ncbi:oligosaccharide flippase family protein [Candidatus Daviesbacteria bacterium]|nr:oligosaccharide flippase family protein [Candidatus Daviesbacteria bacterium]